MTLQLLVLILRLDQKAPEFTVHTQDWSTFNGLQDTKGKVRIISSLLSLSTSVCDRETRRFNQEATALDEQIVILTVSMDLPYHTEKLVCCSRS